MTNSRVRDALTAAASSKDKGPPTVDGVLSITPDSSDLIEWRSKASLETSDPSSTYLDGDEDGLRPHELYGKFTWKIENFSDMNKRELRSNVFDVGQYKWYILVYPQGCDVCNHLSLFLCVADYDKLLPGWSHFAQFTIAVVNKDPKKSKYSDTLHRFCKKEHDWGWKKFMELSKVHDGFVVGDTLVIKAQIQVILDKPGKPFRCLDTHYRRELVRVYLTNVESICRRFCEEKRLRLSWLKEEEEKFVSFWKSLTIERQRIYLTHKCDAIFKSLVKQFFNEKEVTSTLVMDALYTGCRQIEESSRLWFQDKSIPPPLVVIFQERGCLAINRDLTHIAEWLTVELMPAFKDDKMPPVDSLALRNGSDAEDLRRDSIERDERRLAELGRKTVEVAAIVHVISEKLEIAFREAEARRRQDQLIAEEEEAGRANDAKILARAAAEKEKKAKRKERMKQKREVERLRREAEEAERRQEEEARRLDHEKRAQEMAEKKRQEDLQQQQQQRRQQQQQQLLANKQRQEKSTPGSGTEEAKKKLPVSSISTQSQKESHVSEQAQPSTSQLQQEQQQQRPNVSLSPSQLPNASSSYVVHSAPDPTVPHVNSHPVAPEPDSPEGSTCSSPRSQFRSAASSVISDAASSPHDFNRAEGTRMGATATVPTLTLSRVELETEVVRLRQRVKDLEWSLAERDAELFALRAQLSELQPTEIADTVRVAAMKRSNSVASFTPVSESSQSMPVNPPLLAMSAAARESTTPKGPAVPVTASSLPSSSGTYSLASITAAPVVPITKARKPASMGDAPLPNGLHENGVGGRKVGTSTGSGLIQGNSNAHSSHTTSAIHSSNLEAATQVPASFPVTAAKTAATQSNINCTSSTASMTPDLLLTRSSGSGTASQPGQPASAPHSFGDSSMLQRAHNHSNYRPMAASLPPAVPLERSSGSDTAAQPVQPASAPDSLTESSMLQRAQSTGRNSTSSVPDGDSFGDRLTRHNRVQSYGHLANQSPPPTPAASTMNSIPKALSTSSVVPGSSAPAPPEKAAPSYRNPAVAMLPLESRHVMGAVGSMGHVTLATTRPTLPLSKSLNGPSKQEDGALPKHMGSLSLPEVGFSLSSMAMLTNVTHGQAPLPYTPMHDKVQQAQNTDSPGLDDFAHMGLIDDLLTE